MADSTAEGVRETGLGILREQLPDVDVELVRRLEEWVVECCEAFCDARNFTCSVHNPRFMRLYVHGLRQAVRLAQKRPDLLSVDVNVLLSTSRENLFPDVWAESVSQYSRRLEQAYQTKRVAKTRQYACPRCKQHECDFYEMQVRSADESMTMFFTCLSCGYQWRVG